MEKINYPIERQLEAIAARYGYYLPKNPDEMDEDELHEQEEIAAKYVKWVEDDRYAQMVPVDLKMGHPVIGWWGRWNGSVVSQN